MNVIEKLLSSIEIMIRYFITGVIAVIVYILSRTDHPPYIELITQHQTFIAASIAIIGFICFSIYRMLFWFAGDAIAWKCGWSAPSIFNHQDLRYDKPYTNFLEWKYSEKANNNLLGYLTYRWSIAHVFSLSGIMLLIAIIYKQDLSIIQINLCLFIIIDMLILFLGFWQCAFLYRVERNLCSNTYLTKN